MPRESVKQTCAHSGSWVLSDLWPGVGREATRLEAIAIRLEALAIRLEAIALYCFVCVSFFG